jgi:hypothetical protein
MAAKFRILLPITLLLTLFGCAGERNAATATPVGLIYLWPLFKDLKKAPVNGQKNEKPDYPQSLLH